MIFHLSKHSIEKFKAACILSLCLCVFIDGAEARNSDFYGVRPFVSATRRLNQRWDVNLFYTETFNSIEEDRAGRHYPARDVQSYFQAGVIYRLSPQANLAIGYVFQKTNPFSQDYLNENRFWQQVVYSQSVLTGNVSHRFRFEERFVQDRKSTGTLPMATRLRYQLSFTSAFIGDQIVNGSWFYTFYNEFYWTTSGERNAFFSEDWIYGGLGYQTADYGRIEFGPLLQWGVVNKAHDTRTFLLAQMGWSFNF